MVKHEEENPENQKDQENPENPEKLKEEDISYLFYFIISLKK